MPGYLMHLAEGQMILNKLKTLKNHSLFNIPDENDFLLGCILPDAVTDKELTHFRPQSQKGQITKYPDMAYVLDTYLHQPLSSCDFGVLAHLHLDTQFVTDFWPKYFIFLDANESYTNITSDIDHVKIYATGQYVPFEQFFSNNWFYREYDILNPFIISSTKPRIPEIHGLPVNIHIHECTNIDYSILKTIVTKLSKDISFMDSKTANSNIFPKIFPKDNILDFLEETANEFVTTLFLRK